MDQIQHAGLSNVDLEIISGWCKGCGLCVSACPKGVLSLDNKGKVSADLPLCCTGCGTCESTCPDFAISVVVKKNE